MANKDNVVLSATSARNLHHAINDLAATIPPDVHEHVMRVYLDLSAEFGHDETFHRMNMQLLSDLILEYPRTDTAAVIASGVIDGLKYTLHDTIASDSDSIE